MGGWDETQRKSEDGVVARGNGGGGETETENGTVQCGWCGLRLCARVRADLKYGFLTRHEGVRTTPGRTGDGVTVMRSHLRDGKPTSELRRGEGEAARGGACAQPHRSGTDPTQGISKMQLPN
jgi:hypothetical protein